MFNTGRGADPINIAPHAVEALRECDDGLGPGERTPSNVSTRSKKKIAAMGKILFHQPEIISLAAISESDIAAWMEKANAILAEQNLGRCIF